jgi:SNF2 family DNA or RNA helicase
VTQLIERKDVLASEKIYFDLQLNQRIINDSLSKLFTDLQEKNDWFDLNITVETGGFRFPFTSLVPNLKSGERLFSLPDGTSFLIPVEWFSRFKSLSQLGKIEKDTFLIQKNQYMLLEEARLIEPQQIHKNEVVYAPTGQVQATLRAYQNEGVDWLVRNYQRGFGACLADDMGLGKTLQALAILLERAPGGPQLVVTPTSVTHNWLSESDRFAPTLKVRDYRRHRDLSQMGAFDVVVVSYGLLLQDAKAFSNQTWHSIVLDEAKSR